MSLFGKDEKKEIERLKSMVPPESVKLEDLRAEIGKSRAELANIKSEIEEEKRKLSILKQQIVETNEEVLLQSFGFYTPHYSYTTSDEYKEKLKQVRDEQKVTVRNGYAVTGKENWTVNGDKKKGEKMVKDMQKLLLRAFHSECDDAIEHVKFNNIEACEKKIKSSAEAISKLGSMLGISVKHEYIKLKIKELRLMHEYQVKKQEEKEEAKELRQRQREEAKAAKELEEARKKLEKEQAHYKNALAQINEQLEKASESERSALEVKRNELLEKVSEIDSDIEQVDYRAANQRAGYVYVISNIGAFGENIYKIGMTRRLDPMDRVDELGDASVPFNFDVHAMIFTEDAPKLEAALHHAFDDRKVNFVNHRREFFNVSLDEIKNVIKMNYDKTVEFVDYPPAEQYRESIRLKELQTASVNLV